MVDFRRTVLALLTAVAATAAFAQEQPGRPAGERGHAEPGRQEQNAPGVQVAIRCCRQNSTAPPARHAAPTTSRIDL